MNKTKIKQRLKASWIKSICNWHWKEQYSFWKLSSQLVFCWIKCVQIQSRPNHSLSDAFSHYNFFHFLSFLLILKDLNNSSQQCQCATAKSVIKCI